MIRYADYESVALEVWQQFKTIATVENIKTVLELTFNQTIKDECMELLTSSTREN
jgi:hypothetical protein